MFNWQIDTTTSAFQAQQGWHEAEEILELLQGSFPATEVHGIDGFSPKTINSLVKAHKKSGGMGCYDL